MELSKGVVALTTEDEQQEIMAIKPRVKLQYLKNSRQCGLRLWNVLAPMVPGYTYSAMSGVPTFSLETLKSKGLVP